MSNAFASFETTTKTLTTTGDTIELREDVSARDVERVLGWLRDPDTETMANIALVFLDSWSVKLADGNVAPINADVLGELRYPVRVELFALVDAHVSEYLKVIIPDVLKGDSDPLDKGKAKKARRTGA